MRKLNITYKYISKSDLAKQRYPWKALALFQEERRTTASNFAFHIDNKVFINAGAVCANGVLFLTSSTSYLMSVKHSIVHANMYFRRTINPNRKRK